MFGTQHILTRMAALVTVGDVCSPILTNFDAETKITEAAGTWQALCADSIPSDPLAYISMVECQDKIIGWLDFVDLVADPKTEDSVKTCMKSISVQSLVTAETPLLEAMKLFKATSPFSFLVIKGNKIVGFLSYLDILSIPFRACLFSMLLSIEQTMLNIVQTAPDLAVEKLDKKNVERITNGIKKRDKSTRKIRAAEILENLLFSDILNIIENCGETKACLSSLEAVFITHHQNLKLDDSGKHLFEQSEKTHRRVDQIKDLRNALAHPKDPNCIYRLLPKEDLQEFFRWLTVLENELISFSTGNKLADLPAE